MGTPAPKRFIGFREGKEAYQAGVPRSACPFPSSSPEAQNWQMGWDALALEATLEKSPVPDLSLIAEAENLIPKGDFYCSHELSRMLHYYTDACHENDRTRIKNCERSLRRGIVKARLEAAKNLKHPER